MKLLGHDHPIIFVKDLAKAEADFRGLGFAIVARPDAGVSETEVRFAFFGDGSYLELFSFKDPDQPSSHRWWALRDRPSGWVDYAVAAQDVAGFANALQSGGLPASAPREGGKSLLNGNAWRVRVVDAGIGAGRPIMPMLIEDMAVRGHRVPPPDPRETVPAAGAGVVGVTLVTDRLDDEARRALDLVYGPSEPIAPRLEGAASARIHRFMGRWVEVVEASDRPTGDLSAHLADHGEGVFEVTLGWAGKTFPGDGRLLPIEQTAGARLRLAD